MSHREIDIDGETYRYKVGRSAVNIRKPSGAGVTADVGKVKGLRPGVVERGRHKGSSDGMVTPFDVRQYVIAHVLGDPERSEREIAERDEAARRERAAESDPVEADASPGLEAGVRGAKVYTLVVDRFDEDAGFARPREIAYFTDPAEAKRRADKLNSRVHHDPDAPRFRAREDTLDAIPDAVKREIDEMLAPFERSRESAPTP